MEPLKECLTSVTTVTKQELPDNVFSNVAPKFYPPHPVARPKNMTMKCLPVNNKDVNDNNLDCLDAPSLRGQFGWEQIGKEHIPYILRAEEKYCAVRMLEMTAFKMYFKMLHQDLCNCVYIKSYTITIREGLLLTEINAKHCDFRFGKEMFNKRDQLIRLRDALEFYNFLHYCHTKLMYGDVRSDAIRNGFVRLAKESVIPYTMCDGEKFVPLFCFEGETEVLEKSIKTLDGWELAYLKFCCLLQGIRLKLFQDTSCAVVGLEVIKQYFPSGTIFEDFWPSSNLNAHLLLINDKENSIKLWTSPVVPPSEAADAKKVKTVKRQLPKSFSVAPKSIPHPPSDLPPLTSLSDFLANGRLLGESFMKLQPNPPLQQIDKIDNVLEANRSSNAANIFLPPAPPAVSTNNSGSTDCGPITYEFVQIPELPDNPNNAHFAYRIQQAFVDGKMLLCINLKPYLLTELALTVKDMGLHFFNNVPLSTCHKVLKILKVQVFIPNSVQKKSLIRARKCFSMKDEVYLIKLKDLVDFMPQLKYMLKGH